MGFDVFCSDALHPTFLAVTNWANKTSSKEEILVTTEKSNLKGGNFLILISVTEVFSPELIANYDHALVVHGSDLPNGRGWSPIIWQLLSGQQDFTLSLIEATNPVDSGRIWNKIKFQILPNALFGEIQNAIAENTIKLISDVIDNHDSVSPQEQIGEVTYFKRRTPADSELDPRKSIEENFDLIRVSDPVRYPAFFELRGKRYRLQISEY
jgi:methionyl-tRNA formyltransferase